MSNHRPGLATACLGVLAALSLGTSAACPAVPSDEGCIEGTSQACSCTDGRSGAQLCRPDGTFEPCACQGGGDAGASDGSGIDATTGTACEVMCGHVYDCGFSFNDTAGNPVSEPTCVQLCDGNAFSASEVACFSAAACSASALNACWGAGGPVCPRDADCGARVCGADPVCATSCGSCWTGQSCSGAGQCTTPQGWAVEVVSPDDVEDATLAIDAAGNVQAMWVSSAGQLVWAQRGASGWTPQTVEPVGTLSLGVEQIIGFDHAADGTPHAAVLAPVHGALHHVWREGGTWHNEAIETASDVGGYAALRVDSQDRVHVSYQDGALDRLKYARRAAGGGWEVQVVDAESWTGAWTALALASDDTPRIAFARGGASVHYASPSGTAWHIQQVESGDQPGFVSLALDSADRPHLAYFQRGLARLRHAEPDGAGGWTLTTVDAVGDGNAWNDLAIASDGTLRLVYAETSMDDLKLATRSAGAWSSAVIDQAGGGILGLNCSIALGASGAPRLLHRTTRYQARLMYVAAP